ncbi:MarR family winged helix-turn-helix transcriptional regulator [Gryllotalpicola ginsengisoli]|uniref:MarR family winged helix-turn-helix transcriptional regulator n=1 Tax=Gryllotalpicola ginsengisoli TaxID=444608 RepID=UPI0003B725B7|nr:MarR family winged helix-turn-helix transcriptional regulator [Gryllotalpicola ginsengisoli]
MDAPIDFFRVLVRAEILLYNEVDERIRSAHEVTVGTLEILDLLTRLEHPRVDDIVRELDLRVGTASKVVDRFAASGWVERVPNPHDRRSSWLVVTDAGRKLLAAAKPTFEASVDELAGSALTASELRTLRRLLGKLAAGLERRPS